MEDGPLAEGNASSDAQSVSVILLKASERKCIVEVGHEFAVEVD
ncbi:MAG: hypothetical protein ACOC6F_00025 [bacterium]